MDIGIIDADLIGRTRHRFPNLVCMKISNYYKVSGGNRVVLITEYTDSIKKYDKVFLSKVFTDREYVECQQLRHKKECSETRYLKQIERDIPALANTYFDMKCEHWNKERKS